MTEDNPIIIHRGNKVNNTYNLYKIVKEERDEAYLRGLCDGRYESHLIESEKKDKVFDVFKAKVYQVMKDLELKKGSEALSLREQLKREL